VSAFGAVVSVLGAWLQARKNMKQAVAARCFIFIVVVLKYVGKKLTPKPMKNLR
jgi:hypothetical protein